MEHTDTPSGYINTVPINLTHMLSDNLKTCANNKYTNMFGDEHGKRTVAIPVRLKSIYTYLHALAAINTVPM